MAKPVTTRPAADARTRVAHSGVTPADKRALIAAIAVLAMELAVATGVNAAWIGPLFGLAMHALIVTFAFALVVSAMRRKVDTGPAILLAVATAVTGPLGAFGSIMIGWLVSLGRESPDLLKAWYKRISLSTDIDPMTRLSDTVAIGRSLDHASPLPSSFDDVLHHGNTADQQKILGLIARKFHPGYLPVLQIALAHEAPVIRVQAAAVAAHIRLPVAHYVAAVLDRVSAPGIGPAEGLQAVRNIRLCLASGLLDERDRVRVKGLVAGLEMRCFADIDHRGLRASELDTAAREDYEQHLLSNNRFADFRMGRRRTPRRLFGRYVVRNTQWIRRATPAVGVGA